MVEFVMFLKILGFKIRQYDKIYYMEVNLIKNFMMFV
jgi:hypothetical protein